MDRSKQDMSSIARQDASFKCYTGYVVEMSDEMCCRKMCRSNVIQHMGVHCLHNADPWPLCKAAHSQLCAMGFAVNCVAVNCAAVNCAYWGDHRPWPDAALYGRGLHMDLSHSFGAGDSLTAANLESSDVHNAGMAARAAAAAPSSATAARTKQRRGSAPAEVSPPSRCVAPHCLTTPGRVISASARAGDLCIRRLASDLVSGNRS